MSNLSDTTLEECTLTNGCDALRLILSAKDKDLGGFSVRRLLPVRGCRQVGPWVFFDHMGPAQFAAGQGIDVRPHPHIGLATVTYLFEGEMLHRDSLGTVQTIRPGAINLMVAGRGIVHSERQRDEIKSQPHGVHGLQLWLALPAEQEQCAPGFYHYDSAAIPSATIDGVALRVMMGKAYGLSSPVLTLSDTLYVEARLHAGQALALPEARERAVYVVSGELQVAAQSVRAHELAVFDDTQGIRVSAVQETVLAIIGGEPLGERFMDWNFVASDKGLIEKARRDWQAGHFAKIPGDDQEFIPLPS